MSPAGAAESSKVLLVQPVAVWLFWLQTFSVLSLLLLLFRMFSLRIYVQTNSNETSDRAAEGRGNYIPFSC